MAPSHLPGTGWGPSLRRGGGCQLPAHVCGPHVWPQQHWWSTWPWAPGEKEPSLLYLWVLAQSLACFPGGTGGKETRLPMQGTLEMQVQALGGEELPQKGMATYSSILTCRSPWAEEAGGLQSMGSQRVKQDWATLLHFTWKSAGMLFNFVTHSIWS